MVFVLNIQANKIYPQTVENVHFEKKLGIAEIPPDVLKNIISEEEIDMGTWVNDYETYFEGMEMSSYQALPVIISNQKIESRWEERGNIAHFIYLHHLRSYGIMKSDIKVFEEAGLNKFEYFSQLRHILTDEKHLIEQTAPIFGAKWQLFKTDEDAFPLCDTPILAVPGNLLVALSPRLLLRVDFTKIDMTETGDIIPVILAEPATKKLIKKYRNRTIMNTHKEIIFSNREVLEIWKSTEAYKKRYRFIKGNSN